MKCLNCGNEVRGNFCTKCGAKVPAPTIIPTPEPAPKNKGNTALMVTALIVGGIAVLLLIVFMALLCLRGFKKDTAQTDSGTGERYEEREDDYNDDFDDDDEINGHYGLLNYDDDSYLYPTDNMYIREYELRGLTKDEVALVRNEIYARHGYTFSNPRYTEFFSQKSWYYPDPWLTDGADVEQYFNPYEMENKRILVQYEKDMGWR